MLFSIGRKAHSPMIEGVDDRLPRGGKGQQDLSVLTLSVQIGESVDSRTEVGAAWDFGGSRQRRPRRPLDEAPQKPYQALLVQEVTPVSSTVPTEAADGVVPVVRASGIPGEWKRAEPVGETLEIGKEEMKPPEPSLSNRQSMKCLPGNGRTVRTPDFTLRVCGSALQKLPELTVTPRPMDWTPQPVRSCPAAGSLSGGGTPSLSRGLWHRNCPELSQRIERD
ncbi:uncharacterized protein LOC126637606 [Myiozetetes cayanensis]|uniref:uncharacterized protein LOC126637606 n=1 Tax=Myiozetetes cayanensis TaxID=478635 RepID=UPI00215E0077|nr:uncharacterized protein LOC126637606 [Myiozetetes cayanensis]